MTSLQPPVASTSGRNGVRAFPASELREATGSFHQLCLVGEGGFGKVYRAMVRLQPVAIKVLDPEGMQGLREFHNELKLLGSMRHPHVVRLLGYAAEGSTQCLVYELMSHGNLEEALAAARAQGGSAAATGQQASTSAQASTSGRAGGPSLPWLQRLRIAAQVGGALEFLHSRGIIHRDIKPANVFLDCDMNAKLGDIGLAADTVYAEAAASGVSDGDTAVGTWCYLAPEYKTRGRSSVRTDVYAYGLMMLQLLTSAAKPRDLIRRCQAALEDGSLLQVVDAGAGAWDVRLVERVVKLSLWCCMHDPDQRPPMATISAELGRLADVAQQQQQQQQQVVGQVQVGGQAQWQQQQW